MFLACAHVRLRPDSRRASQPGRTAEPGRIVGYTPMPTCTPLLASKKSSSGPTGTSTAHWK